MNFFIEVIVWTFALYGSIEIIKKILSYYVERKNKPAYMVLTVKNGEQYIEGILRSELYKEREHIKQIFVIDLNSNDNTKEIVKKLEASNGLVRLVDWEECKKIINKKGS